MFRMETKMWLVRFATVAVMGSLAFGANAAGRRAPRRTTAVPVAPDPEPSPATLAADKEGPFAPTGKTGKLKEEPPPPGPHSHGRRAERRRPSPKSSGSRASTWCSAPAKRGTGSQVVESQGRFVFDRRHLSGHPGAGAPAPNAHLDRRDHGRQLPEVQLHFVRQRRDRRGVHRRGPGAPAQSLSSSRSPHRPRPVTSSPRPTISGDCAIIASTFRRKRPAASKKTRSLPPTASA